MVYYRQVMRMEAREIDNIRDTVAYYAKRYGAERVYLFGSYACGNATENSDIDLRIDKGAIRGLQMAGLLLDLRDSLKKDVDLVPTGSLSEAFLSAIRPYEVLLYEAE